MKIHHIGYCIKKIDEAISEFKKLGYEEFGEKTLDEHRNISIQFMKNHFHMVELVSPIGNRKSPVDSTIKKLGNTPYHICYETDDIKEEINKLKKEKYILIESPKEAIAIGSCNVAFLFNRNVGIIELVEFK